MVAASKQSKILGPSGRPLEFTDRSREEMLVRRYAQLKAKYDATSNGPEFAKHFGNADHLSPNAAANPEVRRKLRSRSRYELQENNSFGKGILLTLENDVVGTGPKPQIKTANPAANKLLESRFRKWMRAVGLGRKLRTLIGGTVGDGESFLVARTNPRVRHQVKLDLVGKEADLCSSVLWQGSGDPNYEDGIRYDSLGNPTTYEFLDFHPGDMYLGRNPLSKKDIRWNQVIHFFREDRAGQRRGIPWVAPALPLFGQMRRYTLAVIAAAETAASASGVMYTDNPLDDDPDEVVPMDAIELELRSLLTLPAGWKMAQVKAEQPTTTYAMFRDAILQEIARCLCMPFNKAAGNSSGYNYASGRLDHQTYFEMIKVIRSDIEEIALDVIFQWWLEEAMFIPGMLPDGIGPLGDIEVRWRWPRATHIDPLKQASADRTNWTIGMLSDEEFCLTNDLDPEEHYESMRRMIFNRTDIGLPMPGEVPLPVELHHGDGLDGDGEDE